MKDEVVQVSERDIAIRAVEAYLTVDKIAHRQPKATQILVALERLGYRQVSPEGLTVLSDERICMKVCDGDGGRCQRFPAIIRGCDWFEKYYSAAQAQFAHSIRELTITY